MTRGRTIAWYGAANWLSVRLALLGVVALTAGCTGQVDRPASISSNAPAKCERVLKANVVALAQVYAYNRFGSYNPLGMVYALRRDVVRDDGSTDTAIPITAAPLEDGALAGHVRLRSGKRPRPLVLRANEGDCLDVTFTNLLPTADQGAEVVVDPETGAPRVMDVDLPKTRHASMHVNGLELGDIRSDGTHVGRNPSGLVAPGETITYRWYARAEGGYLLYSTADPISGEGHGGQLGLGLFGSVNVEPRNSTWYRSQVSGEDMTSAETGLSPRNTPILDYGKAKDGVPLLAILDDHREIVHSDLNAVIEQGGRDPENCSTRSNERAAAAACRFANSQPSSTTN